MPGFVARPASGMERYGDLVFHPFVRSQGAILLRALGGSISVLWTQFFSSNAPNFGEVEGGILVWACLSVSPSVRHSLAAEKLKNRLC